MTIYTAAITLILVMDPLGNIPVFLSVLRPFSPQRRARIIVRETVIAFLILVLFLFFGHYIMALLHLSTDALGIAGGIILFLIAIRMIFPPEAASVNVPEKSQEEPFVVPLAVPFTAGPSALATVLLFVSRDPAGIGRWFLAVVLATIFFLVVMLCSQYLMRFLGRRGLIAVERLMGMILTTVAVQMFLSGIEHFLSKAG